MKTSLTKFAVPTILQLANGDIFDYEKDPDNPVCERACAESLPIEDEQLIQIEFGEQSEEVVEPMSESPIEYASENMNQVSSRRKQIILT